MKLCLTFLILYRPIYFPFSIHFPQACIKKTNKIHSLMNSQIKKLSTVLVKMALFLKNDTFESAHTFDQKSGINEFSADEVYV